MMHCQCHVNLGTTDASNTLHHQLDVHDLVVEQLYVHPRKVLGARYG